MPTKSKQRILRKFPFDAHLRLSELGIAGGIVLPYALLSGLLEIKSVVTHLLFFQWIENLYLEFNSFFLLVLKIFKIFMYSWSRGAPHASLMEIRSSELAIRRSCFGTWDRCTAYNTFFLWTSTYFFIVFSFLFNLM